MSVFTLISTVILGGWSGLFVSTTFRQTFMNWPTASRLFGLVYTFLGAICLKNFNKGLKHFRKPSPVSSNKVGSVKDNS